MHVALPEIDGRILTRAISFKAANARDAATEFAAVSHQPLADRVAFAADIAAAWVRLRRKAPRRSGSPAYCRIIRRVADARATRSARHARERGRHGREFARAGYDVAPDCDAPALIARYRKGLSSQR